MHVLGETSGSIATVLYLLAVSIEDSVIKIDIGAAWRFDLQKLIETDSEMPVCQLSYLFCSQLHPVGDLVQDQEVIAQALHFGEWH